MNEIILKGKNNGLPVMVGTIVLYALAILGVFSGSILITVLSNLSAGKRI